MSAFIEQLIDYTHADTTVGKLYRASQIDVGTKLSLDFLDPQSYADGVVPAAPANGQKFNNLIDAGGTKSLAVPAALVINTAGLKLTGVAAQYIDLGAEGMFPADAALIGFGGWVKSRDNSGDANAYSAVAGYLATTNNCQWVIQRARGVHSYTGQIGSDGNGAVSIALSVDEEAHIFYTGTIADGSVTVRGYKNGALVGTSPTRPLTGGVLPTPAAVARIGQCQGYNQSVNAEVGAFDIQNFGVAGSATVAEFLARAYGDNVGRFA